MLIEVCNKKLLYVKKKGFFKKSINKKYSIDLRHLLYSPLFFFVIDSYLKHHGKKRKKLQCASLKD